jgi:protein-L-isoaspartate(D-aspartate) O-methyltransferase
MILMDNEFFAAACEKMITEQIQARGINDPALLAALRRVPRHKFIPPALVLQAYADGPLPIGLDQTISQPYIVALMTDLLDLKGNEKVLEIGTGSGYQAAVLAELVKTVHTVERHPMLAEKADRLLSDLHYTNIFVHQGDGSLGWPETAPYDVILVTAAAPSVPPPLFEQMADGGRLVIPVGTGSHQDLQLWQRRGKTYDCQNILAVAFVPLRGQFGWPFD